MPEATVAAGIVSRLIDFASSRGASRATLAERSQIDPEQLEDLDARVPFGKYVTLMRTAKDLTGDPALALNFGEMVDMSEFSVVGLLFHASETLAEAIAQVNRYGHLVTEVDVGGGDRFQVERREGKLWLVDTRRNPNDFPELTEATFARLVGMTRGFGDTPFVKELHVTHSAPAYRGEYERICQGPVLFDCSWNALRVEEAALRHRIAVQPRFVFGILSDRAETLLGSLESSKSMRSRVETLLMPILHTGDAGVEIIAARLGLSRKTLYRKLRAEDVTFEKILDELRHKLATHYLSGRKVSVSETAYLVGFSDPAAFSRAFKRWTGRSPRSVRRA